MIKVENNDILLDGDGKDLLLEATSVLIRVIQTLVEENCLSPNDVPNVIDIVTNELHKHTQPLMIKNNKKYN